MTTLEEIDDQERLELAENIIALLITHMFKRGRFRSTKQMLIMMLAQQEFTPSEDRLAVAEGMMEDYARMWAEGRLE